MTAEPETFECRSCGEPVEAKTTPAGVGYGTMPGEEYAPVTCSNCGQVYSPGEVAAMMEL